MPLKWRKLVGGMKIAVWVRGRRAVRFGFPIRTRRLWSGIEPTATEIMSIEDQCFELDREVREWAKGIRRKHKSPTSIRRGMIYFVRAGDRVKIGFSVNVAARMANLQVGSGHTLELLGALPGTKDRERAVHARFRRHRERGEWFRFEGLLAEFIVANGWGTNHGERSRDQISKQLKELSKISERRHGSEGLSC